MSDRPKNQASLRRLLSQKLTPEVMTRLVDCLLEDALDPEAAPAWRTACLKAITENAMALPRLPEGETTEAWTQDAVRVVGEVAAEGGDVSRARAQLEAENIRQGLLLKSRTSGADIAGQVVYVNLPGAGGDPPDHDGDT